MDRGQSDASEVLAQLRRTRRSAHVVALMDNRQRRLLNARVVVGPRPPGFSPRTWAYQTHTFASATVRASTLANWFAPAAEGQMTLAQQQWQVPAIQPTTHWARHGGRQVSNPLPWPIREFSLRSAMQTPDSTPTMFLVGVDHPSFPTLGAAHRAFFDGNWRSSGSQEPQGGQFDIRIVDDDAYFTRVRVAGTWVEATVAGRPRPGTLLELNSASNRQTIPVQGSGRYRIKFDTVPDDAWLWLKDGGSWLDYRALTSWPAHDSGVEMAMTVDAQQTITDLIGGGEGPTLEFKSELPDKPDQKRGVFKTVAAFANGGGGTILFGVADDGDICGVQGAPAKLRDRVTALVRDLLEPMPQIDVTVTMAGNRQIVALSVAPGAGVLHALTVHKNRPEYYVRRGATTFYARPQEIAKLTGRHVTSSYRTLLQR